jgi:hypothetical protein
MTPRIALLCTLSVLASLLPSCACGEVGSEEEATHEHNDDERSALQ